jgi:A/G-specific adenine glycosylase
MYVIFFLFIAEMNFSLEIINWYKLNKRDLPWRNTMDPYKIWISEIILQQTKVSQGLPYYLEFCKTFSTVEKLASANEEQVLKLWQGLGYYSRARNLHFASKQIVNKFESKFPSNYNDIISLKGVGKYTAAAIASFAFKLPYSVVDGNVYRLLSRYFEIYSPINSSTGEKLFAELAQTLLDKKTPDIYNQAIMEFGAIMCKPKEPNCIDCPLSQNCKAYLNKKVKELPVKIRKAKQKKLFFEYLYISFKSKTYLRKRIEEGIWKNLYEFPLLEYEQKKSEKEVLENLKKLSFLKNSKLEVIKNSEVYKHILSHRIIFGRVWTIQIEEKLESNDFVEVPENLVNTYPMSRLMEIFLENNISLEK